MSRPRGCEFIEPEPGKWYLILDDSDIANAWDWRENADCYGPFPTEDAARKEVHDNHSNPGGYSTIPHGDFHPCKVYTDLIAQAIKPRRRFGEGGVFEW